MFLGASLALGAGAFLFLNSDRGSKVKFYANNVQVLLHTAYHLFPHSKLGPGALDLHISHYLGEVLKDKRILQADREYYLKGAFWLEESSFEIYDKSFLNLSLGEKEDLFQKVSRYSWGENYIYTSLNYILEALLCAPVYGSNPDAMGWKWLEHNPGFPQPKSIKEISYEV